MEFEVEQPHQGIAPTVGHSRADSLRGMLRGRFGKQFNQLFLGLWTIQLRGGASAIGVDRKDLLREG